MYSRYVALLFIVNSAHNLRIQPYVQRYPFTPHDYRMINGLAFTNALAVKAPVAKKQHEQPSRHVRPPLRDDVSEYAKFCDVAQRDAYVYDVNDETVPKNHRPRDETEAIRRPAYVRDHAPVRQNELESEAASKSEAKVKKKSSEKKSTKSNLFLSPDGDRVEFRLQGHNGPKSYVFGFDTGDGLEERLKDGSVKGRYGYYDAKGKLRTISYLARPSEGYREKHHEQHFIPNSAEKSK